MEVPTNSSPVVPKISMFDVNPHTMDLFFSPDFEKYMRKFNMINFFTGHLHLCGVNNCEMCVKYSKKRREMVVALNKHFRLDVVLKQDFCKHFFFFYIYFHIHRLSYTYYSAGKIRSL
ncbi:hypothetical protein CHUAL_010743 [Chamberlinius hualienensis]